MFDVCDILIECWQVYIYTNYASGVMNFLISRVALGVYRVWEDVMFIFYPVTASCLCIMWGNMTPLLPPSPSLHPRLCCLENDDTMKRETVIIPAYNTYKAYMYQSKEILLLIFWLILLWCIWYFYNDTYYSGFSFVQTMYVRNLCSLA